MAKKFKIQLNSIDNLELFLQEISDEAYRTQNQIQSEMNKLISSTDLTNEPIDGKAKYAKSMHDYYGDLDRANKQRLDVAKIMNEILKYKGDTEAAIDSVNQQVSKGTLDIDSLRRMAKEVQNDKSEYTIKTK